MTTTFAELHCHSNYSFLDGASHPHALVETAAALGYEALAVTDHHDGTETESPTALDHFGYPTDMNNFVDQLVFICILLEQRSASLTSVY